MRDTPSAIPFVSWGRRAEVADRAWMVSTIPCLHALPYWGYPESYEAEAAATDDAPAEEAPAEEPAAEADTTDDAPAAEAEAPTEES